MRGAPLFPKGIKSPILTRDRHHVPANLSPWTEFKVLVRKDAGDSLLARQFTSQGANNREFSKNG